MITDASLRTVRENADLDAAFRGKVTFGDPDAQGQRSALCVWHDDHRPSMSVSQAGLVYCFACGASGTVFSIAQEVFGYGFRQAVEHIAHASGVTVEYTDDTTAIPADVIDVTYAINSASEKWFTTMLGSGEAETARNLLTGRGFPVQDSITAFGVGYAPNDYQALLPHLLGLGFTEEQVITAGLAKNKNDRTYDRFRGRLVWPIRDTAGRVIGFGGRTVIGDEAKFLNPTQTPVYHKTDAYYGVDLAIEHIRSSGTVLIVEGYMDVMACHAAGIHNAIAVNGTAFGPGHVTALRRLVAPSGRWPEVCVAFDADTAGQKAARKAFTALAPHNPNLTALAFPTGADACDVWDAGNGKTTLTGLYTNRQPLMAALIDNATNGSNDTIIETYQAAETIRPLLACIIDPVVRHGWTKEAARVLAVPAASLTSPAHTRGQRDTQQARETAEHKVTEALEWLTCRVAAQIPAARSWAESVEEECFTDPDLFAVFTAILTTGNVVEGLDPDVSSRVTRAYMETITCPPESVDKYGISVIAKLLLAAADRRISGFKGDNFGQSQEQLAALVAYRKELLAAAQRGQ